ncbi:MAG: AAA family ATPase [Gammaproteobacteria bacterium]
MSATRSENGADIRALDTAIDTAVSISAQGSWSDTRYLMSATAAEALIAGLAANRPILVRGEPGVGKSQLARAAAAVLGRVFMPVVVQPDSEYADLLWRIDHTKRLADAQLSGQGGDAGRDARRVVDAIGHYIGPGALWWALSPPSAERQHLTGSPHSPSGDDAQGAGFGSPNYHPGEGISAADCLQRGVVLLIDEVDKADINLTNGLLEVLGNGGFEVPPLGHTVRRAGRAPLVLLTSNNTRELPAALLRRCVVLNLDLGGDEAERMTAIAETVYPDEVLSPKVRAEALKQILIDREHCTDLPRTGLAEYLDLLAALKALDGGEQEALRWLKRLAGFFKKSSLS